jgi:hypothetical protein
MDGDFESAKDAFHEALSRLDELGVTAEEAGLLVDVAVLAQRLGQHEPATRLLGAAEAMNERLGRREGLPWQTVYERTAATLAADLGPEAFARAWETGRALTHEQAFAEARAVIDQPKTCAAGETWQERGATFS